MALTSGTRIGVYEIGTQIGVGGMGEVYRGTDTNLKRSVAIKVLPASVAGDADRLARFQREAEVLAALNHPNIAAIYGLEKTADFTALVMELVEGEDLSQRIASGAIPIDEALAIAKQIAEALENAHEQGIIHRDLKPANIKVRPDGAVKVLDFGLAKAMDSDRGPGIRDQGSGSVSPTLASPALVTGVGMLLGTAAYMSPEQAKGRVVDKRSDVWAFGAVLYEMLCRERAFPGEDVSETLASILRDTPSLDRLPATTPPGIRRLLQRCFERDVRQRLRDIGEARVEIAKIESGEPDSAVIHTAAAAPARRSLKDLIAWGVAGTAVIAALALMYVRPAENTATNARAVRLPFVPPRNVAATDLGAAVISPDGQTLVFSGRSSSGGKRMLWARRLDSLEAQPLPDTEDAIEPFWSPDSRSVGFGAQGKLKRVDIAGGRAQTITDAARFNGGAWSPSGVIVFSPDFNTSLVRVASTGGARVPLTPPNEEARYPAFLPDGRHFLYYTSDSGTQSTMVGSVDAMDVKLLLPDMAPAVYAPPGWVLYNRNGIVVAHAFNPDRLEFTGEPVPVAAGSEVANITVGGRVSVSDNGVLVTQDPPMFDYQLTWFDRAGRTVGTLGPVLKVAAPQRPRLSPDGKHAVIQRFDPVRRQELWMGDVARDTFDRFTTFFAQTAMWSPDGRSVISAMTRNSVNGIYQMPAAGGDAQLMLAGTVFPQAESRDGKWLYYTQRGEKTRVDIWALPLSGDAPHAGSHEPHPVVNSEFDDAEPEVSPDGRWLAYSSDVTGSVEIYVRPLTEEGTAGGATRVSTGGGVQPRWGDDGRELFYINQSRGALAADVTAVPVKASGTTFRAGAAVPLFRVPMAPQPIGRDYDVSPDGQRFLIGTVVNNAPATPITVVLNWMAGLKK